MEKFKVGDIVKQKDGFFYPHIKKVDTVVDVGKSFSYIAGKEVEWIILSSHPSFAGAENFELVRGGI